MSQWGSDGVRLQSSLLFFAVELTPPVRLLHVNAGNLYGGVETFLATLLRQPSSALVHEVALCYEGRSSAELRAIPVPVHLLGAARARYPWTVLRARRHLRTLIRKRAINAVVCHQSWAHALFGPAVRDAQARLLVWAHGPFGGRQFLEWWAKRVVPERIIANSEFTAGSVRKAFQASSVRVIHCAVSSYEVSDPARVRAEVRRELGVEDGTPVIAMAARLEAWKGHRLLLEALVQLKSASWVCWIVGGSQRAAEEEYLAELQNFVTQHDLSARVRFLGFRGDVRRLLLGADVYCQPNVGPEPFGISFVEALDAGLPVVATAMGGALEIVDERCGRLVAPDPARVAEALSELLAVEMTRRTLAAGARARARELCDPVRRLAELEQVLSEGHG